jgi:hypothetical protein
MERALRFFDKNMVSMNEKCYLVGLEDKSSLSSSINRDRAFTLEESLAELSELSGAAGTVYAEIDIFFKIFANFPVYVCRINCCRIDLSESTKP